MQDSGYHNFKLVISKKWKVGSFSRKNQYGLDLVVTQSLNIILVQTRKYKIRVTKASLHKSMRTEVWKLQMWDSLTKTEQLQKAVSSRFKQLLKQQLVYILQFFIGKPFFATIIYLLFICKYINYSTNSQFLTYLFCLFVSHKIYSERKTVMLFYFLK